MTRSVMLLVLATVILGLLAGGCARREQTSALYILEELEAASAVKDPSARVERLSIFIANHADHPYRFLAYNRMFETLGTDMKDEAGLEKRFAEALAKEKDPSARGELLLGRFTRIMEADKPAATAFADSMLIAERSARLFLIMGYYLMDPKADRDLALKCFLKSADLSAGAYEKAQAIAMAGTVLEEQGKRDEAKRYLAMAAGNPEADFLMGKILWDEGKRKEAVDAYISCAARMPGARAEVKLDSLYAIVEPGANDLDEAIMARRIGDGGPMPGGAFVDLNGRSYDLSNLKGKKMVLVAMSPT
jgi:tetratricopeptide (TPR) repeat protein